LIRPRSIAFSSGQSCQLSTQTETSWCALHSDLATTR
jgi:hypothetical protein